MRHRRVRRELPDFLKGLLLSLAIILPVFTAVFFTIKLTSGNSVPIGNEPQEKIAVTQSPSRTLLIACKDDNGPLSAALVRFDVEDSRAIVCDIPLETVLLLKKRPVTTGELVESSMTELCAAIEQTLALKPYRYILISDEALTPILDGLGKFSFTLDKELVVIHDDGLSDIFIESGTRRMGGRELAALLRHGDYQFEEKTKLNERLWRSALTEFLSADLPSKLTGVFLDHSSKLTTNLNAADAYSLAGTIRSACGSSCDIATLRLSGKWVEQRFELSDDCAEQLKNYFIS